MQTSEERAAWLAGLKLNDKVALWSSKYGTDHYSIWTVEDITPTRKKFYLSRPSAAALLELNADGRTKSNSRYDVGDIIVPLSPEVRTQIAHQNAIWKMNKLMEEKNKAKSLTTDQMMRIIAVLEEK